jgi:hypothetical protein
MNTQSIPVLWESGEVSFASFDEHGFMLLRRGSDDEIERTLAVLREAARWAADASEHGLDAPSICPDDAESVLADISRRRKLAPV